MLRYAQPIYKLVRDSKYVVLQEKQLLEMEKTDPVQYAETDAFISDYQQTPIAHFLPHGIKNKEFGNDGVAALNDWKNDLVLWLGPNQCGKSSGGCAYTLLHGLIPMDPTWNIFTKHGVEYHEWQGPKIAIVASWSWDNTIDLYNVYKKWLPRKELKNYCDYWGHFPGEKGKQMDMSFGNKMAKTVKLNCGSIIIFLCYTQAQIHWEGKQCDIAHLDEQCPEDKFDGLTARQLTRGAYTPIIMTLTGHVLPGRPDTGAGGWIKTKMLDQRLTKGRKFGIYRLSVDTVPDAIMSKEQKERAKIQWVIEPQRTRNMKKINEGIARFMGGWEVGGGIIYDEIHPDIHWIDPFDVMQYKPTLYRMIDHGKEPCAALLFAKMPWGDVVVFKEYYMFGKSIDQNAQIIVEQLCGNTRKLIDEFREQGQTWQVYEEIQNKMVFENSELDGRSFASPSMERPQTIGMLWNMAGCTCTPASGLKLVQGIPLVKEYLTLRADHQHIDYELKRKHNPQLDKFGSPSMYFFRGLDNLQMEINGYLQDAKTLKPIANSKDHVLDCVKFFAARDRGYRPTTLRTEEKTEDKKDHGKWTMGL